MSLQLFGRASVFAVTVIATVMDTYVQVVASHSIVIFWPQRLRTLRRLRNWADPQVSTRLNLEDGRLDEEQHLRQCHLALPTKSRHQLVGLTTLLRMRNRPVRARMLQSILELQPREPNL